MSFHHDNPGRRPAKLALVLGVWALLALSWLLLSAAPWIVVPLGLIALPTLIDWLTDRPAWLEIEDGDLRWRNGRQAGELPLHRIARVHLDLRLDFSVRAMVETDGGNRVRLPDDALPSEARFRRALEDCNVTVNRHLFRIFRYPTGH